ncbi:MAG: peptidase M23 [Methylococcales bacterium]|nr:MAG: peptidase M23 [Methylococcales bacterium]
MKITLCLFIMLVFGYRSAYAEDLQANPQFNKVESDIVDVKQDMQRLSEQKSGMEGMLADIEKHYGETATSLKAQLSIIDQHRQGIARIQQEIKIYKREIEVLNKELVGQVRAAYLMGHEQRLKLILNQQDPVLSARIMIYFNYINKERLKNLSNKEAAVKLLSQLDQQKKTETELLQQTLEEKRTEQSLLDQDRKQRNALLTKIKQDYSSNEHQLTQLQENEISLKNLMSSLPITDEELAVNVGQNKEKIQGNTEFKGDFTTLKGSLPWPVKGRLAQTFGSPRADSHWDGVLIEANEGTDIKAVTEGKVVYAEWKMGYGMLLIIDHGHGYMTLYAFNQSLYKHEGDWVEAGDVIATVGQSGGRSQAGLYFGIRQNGTPVDPLEWCHR